MPLAVVQAKKIESGSAASVTVNAAMTVTTGNLLVAGVTGFSATASNATASDQLNGTYTAIGEARVTSGADSSLHYHANITGGSLNLTINAGTGAAAVCVGLFHEVSGADTAAPFTTGEFSATTPATGTNPQTGSVTNSVANSIFFAMLASDNSGNPLTLTVNSTGSSPTGWALADSTNSQELDGSGFQGASCPYLIVSSGAATKHGWTTSSNTPGLVIADFKQASAAAQDTPELEGRPFGMRGQNQLQQLLAQ